MRRLRYVLVDVFTDHPFGGNQLAVFLNGRGLNAATMQKIARELNLSETTFILPPADPANHYQVRIFTPGKELPMAGHPTVGTAFVLAREQMIPTADAQTLIRLEEGVGLIPVTVDLEAGQPVMAKMQQPLPTFEAVYSNLPLIADALSLTLEDLDTRLPVQQVSCGVPCLIIPVKTLDAMRRIKVRLDLYEQLVRGTDNDELFVFTRETVLPGSTVHSRMFAPNLGIPEDPATGAASGPLGCYLVKYGIVTGSPARITSEQGFEMGRESLLHIEITHHAGAFTGVSVGGECVFVGEGFLEIG